MKKQLYLLAIFALFYSCEKEKNAILKTKTINKVEKNDHYYTYSLNSKENIIIIMNGENDTLITDRGIFPIKSEMHENKAYIYHLKYKGKTIGNYFEEFKNISTESICLNSSFSSVADCIDLVSISTDSLRKITLPLEKIKFLKKYKIIE